jgi:hypothetical protein
MSITNTLIIPFLSRMPFDKRTQKKDESYYLKIYLYEWHLIDTFARSIGTQLGETSLDHLRNKYVEILRYKPHWFWGMFEEPKNLPVVFYKFKHWTGPPNKKYTEMNKKHKAYMAAYEVYLSLVPYSLEEVKALVYKNHGIPPSSDHLVWWKYALLHTQRYGFNTFAIKSQLNDDVLAKIKSFV